MTLDNPKGGIGYAAEFQSSALPWVTASVAPNISGVNPMRLDFPKVTRFVTFANGDAVTKKLRIGFTRNGMSNGFYYLLEGGQQITLELRVKEVYVAGDSTNAPFSICAGLTNINSRDMPVLSGTLPNGDAGWLGIG